MKCTQTATTIDSVCVCIVYACVRSANGNTIITAHQRHCLLIWFMIRPKQLDQSFFLKISSIINHHIFCASCMCFYIGIESFIESVVKFGNFCQRFDVTIIKCTYLSNWFAKCEIVIDNTSRLLWILLIFLFKRENYALHKYSGIISFCYVFFCLSTA